MKTVTAVKHTPIPTYSVDCGACGTELPDPATSSLIWNDQFDHDDTIVCYECGATNKIPRGFSRKKASP